MADMKQDDSNETSSFDETKKNRFVKTKNFFSKINEEITPALPYLKNRYLRYSVSFILLGLVVYLYILFETFREEEKAMFLSIPIPTAALVPMGLVFALIMVLYVSWDDSFFKKYRTPGLYMVILTTVFYALIFSGIDTFLFDLGIARWLTKLTGTIVSSILIAFGMNISDVTWLTTSYMTKIDFMTAPSGEAAILIDARCSGIHSLTIFTAIFLIMLFEARKRLRWNYRTGLVTLIGIFGTYFINILRIIIVISLYYFYGGEVGEPVHNYLGYIMLILWIPVFWLFILPLSEKKEIREQRKQKRIERKKKKKKKNRETRTENLEEKTSESDMDDSSSSL